MQQLQVDSSAQVKAPDVSALAVFHAGMLGQEAERWILDYLHRTDGNCCPQCKVEIVDEHRLQRWYQGERIKCPECSRFYTSRTGTELEGSTLDAKELFLLKVLIELAVPAAAIAAIIPVNKETVARWAQRFQAMEQLSA